MYSIEKVCVNIPGSVKAVIEAPAAPSDDDRDIATRLAKGFPVGTIFGFSGAKWKSISKEPPQVVEITHLQEAAPKKRKSFDEMMEAVGPLPTAVLVGHEPFASSQPSQNRMPKPGEVWKPKDPRRVASFKVKEVTSSEVIADDGRTVSLERWSRYVRVD